MSRAITKIAVEMEPEQAKYVRELLQREKEFLLERIADKGPLSMFSMPLESAQDVIEQIDEQFLP